MASNADRRLQRLKNDPAYSGKLSRLTKTQQRSIEKLVAENNGREARARINELDAARREQVRTRSKARRLRDKRDRVVARLNRLHAGKPKLRVKTIRQGVSMLAEEELNKVLKLNEAELAAHVARKIRIPPPPGKINPFFYQ